jgi:Flp pilus assembly protein TadG
VSVFPQQRRGIVALEVLVLLPVFLLMLLSLIEASRLLWTRSILSFAARETVRYALAHSSESTSPATTAQLRQRFIGSTTGLDPMLLTIELTPPPWDEHNDPGTVFRLTARYDFYFFWNVMESPATTLTVYAESVVGH